MNIFNNQTKALNTKFNALYLKFLKGMSNLQLHKLDPYPKGNFLTRINLNYTISCKIEYMYRASTGHKFILVVADKVKII